MQRFMIGEDLPVAEENSPSNGSCLRVLQVIASVSAIRGGPSTAMWNLLKALQLRGIRADLITTDDDGPARRANVPLGVFTNESGHNVCYLRRQTNFYTTSWPLAVWLLRHVSEYDVVHIHGLFGFPPVVAAHIAALRRVPYVLSLHNTLGRWGRLNRRPLLKSASLRLIERRILARAAKVHFASAEELDEACDVIQHQTNSTVIPLGIDLPAAETERTITTDSQELALILAGKQVVLFLARIHLIKGLDRLLSAFVDVHQRFPNVVLLIAGDGDRQLVSSLRKQVTELGIDEAVHWLGFVQGQMKNYVLSIANVFVLPSLSENFGLAVTEAMLNAVPVVVSKQVPIADLISRTSSGITYDGSIAELGKSIGFLLGDPTTARQMGEAGRCAVQNELSIDSFGRRLVDLYVEITESRSAGKQPVSCLLTGGDSAQHASRFGIDN